MRRITLDLRDSLDLGTFIGLIAEHLEAIHKMETLPDPPGRETPAPAAAQKPAPVAPDKPKRRHLIDGQGTVDHAMDFIRTRGRGTFRACEVGRYLSDLGYNAETSSKALKVLLDGGHIARSARGLYRQTVAN